MFDVLFSRSGLSLDRLRSFLLVAESGSISDAAAGDPVRQSLYSRQIRELEEFFGVELTHRRGKTISISPAGRRLAGVVRAQFQDLDDFRGELAGEKQTFTIGAGASLLEWVILPALAKIRKALNGAFLRLEADRTDALVTRVRDGNLDFAVVREDAIPTGKPRASITRLAFCLCVPKSLLRGRGAAKLTDPAVWRRLPFAAAITGGQFDQVLRSAMSDAGFEFRPVVECQSFLQVHELVARGEYAGILPSVGITGFDDRSVAVVPFAPLADYGRTLAFHWNGRQMSRRGVNETVLAEIAAAIQLACPKVPPSGSSPNSSRACDGRGKRSG